MEIKKATWNDWASKITQILTNAQEYKDMYVIEQVKSFPKDDFWSIIWSMNYKNFFFFTRSQYYEMHDMVEIYFRSNEMHLRLDLDTLTNKFIELLSLEFKKKPNKTWVTDNVKNILHAVWLEAKAQLKMTRHYIHCLLPGDTKIDEFSFGPVRFISRDKFWHEISHDIEMYESRLNGKKSFTDEAKSDYENYYWVACIDIADCEHKKSYFIAERCIKYSVLFISLFLHDQFIDITDSVTNDIIEQTSISIADDNLDISYYKKFKNRPSGEWVHNILHDDLNEFVAKFSQFIFCLSNNRKISILGKKLCESFDWYAEGIREKDKSSAIIKFSIALEILSQYEDKHIREAKLKCEKCGFKNKIKINDAISQKFYDRVQYFYSGKIDETCDTRKLITKFYNLRSKIVHGSMYKDDKEIVDFYRQAVQIVKLCLAHFLIWAGNSNLEADIKNSEVELFFDKLLLAEGNIESLPQKDN